MPAAAPALPPARCPACGGAFREVEPTAATGGTDAGSRPAGAEHHIYEARIDAWLGGTATTRVGLVRFALADEDGLIHAARELASSRAIRAPASTSQGAIFARFVERVEPDGSLMHIATWQLGVRRDHATGEDVAYSRPPGE